MISVAPSSCAGVGCSRGTCPRAVRITRRTLLPLVTCVHPSSSVTWRRFCAGIEERFLREVCGILLEICGVELRSWGLSFWECYRDHFDLHSLLSLIGPSILRTYLLDWVDRRKPTDRHCLALLISIDPITRGYNSVMVSQAHFLLQGRTSINLNYSHGNKMTYSLAASPVWNNPLTSKPWSQELKMEAKRAQRSFTAPQKSKRGRLSLARATPARTYMLGACTYRKLRIN